MIELLVVLAIIGVMAILFFFGMRGQIEKGRDAKRKDDLEDIKIAYEDYYSDNDCYPPDDALSNPASTALEPYLNPIPRDPLTDDPYRYLPLSGTCPGYRLLTKLEFQDDPSIFEVGCTKTSCGLSTDYLEVNYGVAVGTDVPEDGFSNGEVPGEGSSPSGRYVVNSDQNCIAIEIPGESNCGGSAVYSTMAECLVGLVACAPGCGACTN